MTARRKVKAWALLENGKAVAIRSTKKILKEKLFSEWHWLWGEIDFVKCEVVYTLPPKKRRRGK